jgi:leucyl aminopeptidase
MKLYNALVLSAAASAVSIPPKNPNRLPQPQVPIEFEELVRTAPPVDQDEKFLIELGPGETKWIVEDEKWALRRV